MKPLTRFALFLAWFWIKWTPCFAFWHIGIDGNAAEAVQMEKDLAHLSHLEADVEAHYV